MTPSTLPIESLLPATFTAPGLSEAEFLKLCAQFPDAMVEYTSDGTVILLPLKDPENAARGAEVTLQLGRWADAHGCHVCGPDVGFHFRDGSWRSPDASWFDRGRWMTAKRPETRFPVFAPDFAIEIHAEDQRIGDLREKMEDYIANGVQLAWLIDPQDRTVTIYRTGQAPELLRKPSTVRGEGPVEGFVLDLERIFA